MRRDIIDDYARLDGTGPARQRGHAKAAFPGGTLLATERRGAAIRPAKFLHPVVRREDDNRIVRNSEIVELLEELANHPVELHHAVGIEAVTALVLPLGTQSRPDVHAGRIVPEEERLVCTNRSVHEIERCGEQLLLNRFHALLCEWSGILDGLLPDHPEAWIHHRVIFIGGAAVQHAARAKLRAEFGRLRIVWLFGLFF